MNGSQTDAHISYDLFYEPGPKPQVYQFGHHAVCKLEISSSNMICYNQRNIQLAYQDVAGIQVSVQNVMSFKKVKMSCLMLLLRT